MNNDMVGSDAVGSSMASSAAMDSVECVVVGAGVVGLAVGRALALSGREVMILEAADDIGTQTSSRNSEVIHAGIYYPAGSAKAAMCVAGREQLYRYCAERDVPHRRLGKLIVATDDDQRAALGAIRDAAACNGVADLTEIGRDELREIEPEVNAVAALLSPSTGIIDSHGLMVALRRDAESAGAGVALRSAVTSVRRAGSHTVIEIDGVGELGCEVLVNCAGLGAWDVARSFGGFPERHIPPRHLAKGSYFALASGPAPFRHLIYPVPVDGGLGVHLTLDLGGAARFGPDVEWVGTIDYSVDPQRGQAFYSAIRRYWPALPDDALVPSYAGIRPKTTGRGAPAGDFELLGPDDHGVSGIIHLFGIESPGLTSCLALGDAVRDMVSGR